jgi:hypothetical protein
MTFNGMKTLFLAIALAFFVAAPALAHPEHDMVEQENPRLLALNSASYVVGRMIERNAIPASWASIEPTSALLRQRNGADEWVVTFRNDAIANPAERTLYVMLTYSGVYIAANYTGE